MEEQLHALHALKTMSVQEIPLSHLALFTTTPWRVKVSASLALMAKTVPTC